MLPSRLRFSLLLAQVVGAAVLFRSVAYDRWATVVAASALILGALAAQRGKTWGIGIALGSSIAFPAAWALGMAPSWFVLVGAVGALPFILTSRAIARFDARATAIGALLASLVGTLAALGWWAAVPYLFTNFPALRPTFDAAHAGVGAVLFAVVAVAIATRWRRSTAESARSRVEVLPNVRVADDAAHDEEQVEEEVAATKTSARLHR